MSRYFYRENRTPQPSVGPLCTPRTLRLACLVFSKVPHQRFILRAYPWVAVFLEKYNSAINSAGDIPQRKS
jgi:hypothetical protein